jgi:hypothetical protein
MRTALLAVALAAAPPASAQVLDVFSDLFESVNSVAFYGHGGSFLSQGELEDRSGLVGGVGVEVFLDLPSPDGLEFELGLGTAVTGGFQATEPSLDLHGSLRTLPRVSVYVSTASLPDRTVVPYVGLGFGLAEVWNATGYTADGSARTLDAEAYELSGAAGVAVVNGPLDGFYAEVGVQRRTFEGVEWGESPLPDGWPRRIDASTVSLSVGWQFRLTRSEPPGDGPATPPGD